MLFWVATHGIQTSWAPMVNWRCRVVIDGLQAAGWLPRPTQQVSKRHVNHICTYSSIMVIPQRRTSSNSDCRSCEVTDTVNGRRLQIRKTVDT
jgi:hypothetical protein